MRTLKKTLALVLVIAMVASFGVIGASADFADVPDTNDYYEAIQVLSGLGIIEGVAENTFDPEGTLTREQAAKIVAYVRLGKNAAIVETTDTAPFTDVAANRWSAGYIGYCANLKIVEGEDEGIFNPEGTLTTAAFAKMLLVAIGFDADANGLNGGNWAINTATCASAAGLYVDSIGISATKPITRAQACELALAALTYSSAGTKTVYVVTKGDVVLYEGSDAMTALLFMSGSNGGDTISTKTIGTSSLGYTNYGLTEDSSKDAFGRESVIWTNGKSGSKLVVYAKFAPEALLTYTSATTYGKIVSALGYTSAESVVTLNVSRNGGETVEVKAHKYDTEKTDVIGGTGTLIEVYKTAADTYSVIVVDTYVTTLAKEDIVAAKKATAREDAEDAYILIEGLPYETEAFAKGDVVLYTKTADKIVNVVKADSFSGAVTATAAGYIRVDGAQKYLSATNEAVIGTTAGYTVSKDSYTYYTDFYGNIIHAVKGQVADVDTDYVYVIATAARAAKSEAGDLFAAGSTTAAAAQAKIIDLETGEIKVVNQGIVQAANGKYYYATKTGAASSDEVADQTATSVGAIYEYATLTDGSIVLIGEADLSGVSLAKGSASIGISGLYANSATVLKVVEYSYDKYGNIAAATVSTTTGIANFPGKSDDRAPYTGVVSANNNGLVVEILVVQPKGAVVESVNYAIYAGMGEYSADGQAYNFYVNGELKGYIGAEGFTAPAEGAVVALTFSDGAVASATEQEALTEEPVEVTAIESTFFVAGGAIYYFADGYEVIDSYDMSVSTLEIGDVIDIYGKTSAVAFIVK